MTKAKFLKSLKKALRGCGSDTVKKTLDYYNEMIDDRMEDGLSEKEAVAALPSIEEIIGDLPREYAAKRERKPLSGREIALLAISFPIWLPLLCAAFALIAALFACILALIVSLFAGEVALIAGAVGGIAMGIRLLVTGDTMQSLVVIGASLAAGGLGLVLLEPLKRLSIWLLGSVRSMCAWIGRRFSGKAVR